MKMMPPRIYAFALGMSLAASVQAQTSYDCRQIAATTKNTMERVIQSGRREIARDESQGGAMDKPKPAKDVSCETQKWQQMVAAAFAQNYYTTGASGASVFMNALMNRLISEACSTLNSELDRARSRVENVVRPPGYDVVFPYVWGQ